MEPVIAVAIPTKDRSEAIGRYALASLARSSFKEFVCVIWDASGDDLTRYAVEKRRWAFLFQGVAKRLGFAAQRRG